MVFGLLLVAIGVLWLLTTLGVLSGSLWTYFWPVALIIIGLSIIWGWRSRKIKGVWHGRFWPPGDVNKQ